jgi:hypothetical protein
LARAVIKHHLSLRLPEACPGVEVNVFPSLDSSEFDEYLHETPLHFVMMHDGSSRSKRVGGDKFKEEEDCAKILLRGAIWWWNSNRLNVSLINRIEFRDSKVFTMIVESFTSSSKRKLAMTTNFPKEISQTRAKLEDLHEEGDMAVEVEATDLEDLSGCPPKVTTSESYFLAAYGISEMLNNDECDVFLASAFILHSITLQHTPLAERRLPLVTFDDAFESRLDIFLAKLSNIFKQTLENESWAGFVKERELKVDTIDLIDGRVFRAVIQSMQIDKIESSLSPAATKDWSMMSRIVMHLAGEELSMNGDTKVGSCKTEESASHSSSETEKLAVLPFSHPVFDKHLECIHVVTDTTIPAKLGALRLYRETTHWHNYKKPLNPKAPVAVKVSKWRSVLAIIKLSSFFYKLYSDAAPSSANLWTETL